MINKEGGRRSRVASIRLRARIDPERVAIPTYRILGVRDSAGDANDFTRSSLPSERGSETERIEL
jgi:hypothetical protein